jgi:hypothetical protein
MISHGLGRLTFRFTLPTIALNKLGQDATETRDEHTKNLFLPPRGAQRLT